MLGEIKILLQEVEDAVLNSEKEVEDFRLKFLGKKGKITMLFDVFKRVSNDSKKEIGQAINMLKNNAKQKVNCFKGGFGSSLSSKKIDFTKPVNVSSLGSAHPISIVKNNILSVFNRVGFVISEGPEIENDWYNFSALNLPEEHPARDMQDTFFVQTNPEILLRTHTSSVQIRHMEKSLPPFRTVSPGRVYRNEAVSARAHCIFHQVEGLYINESVSFSELKQVLFYFAKEMFGEKTKIRIRPSYFPFTEPSAELDIYWGLKTDADYRITKGTGWLEVLGCGMVDPAVLDNCGIDSKKYSGYAFGMGVEELLC
jgi:phenylalanyl-tRNA synthetase alpha chain